MKILALSKDEDIIKLLDSKAEINCLEITYSQAQKSPYDVISDTCSAQPSILILDDDLLKPNTSNFIESVKKLCQSISIIFLTSDDSIELGRKISPFGVHYYAIKPVDVNNFSEALDSLINIKQKNLTH
ncbi:MAG: hypothetical protein ABIJ40_02175 [Bacteroidota bacterium]